MTEPCSSLTVVFTDSPKLDDHLFAKAIKWADQNPEDIIFWARRKALEVVPNVDVDWSSKISALRRIRFGYSRKNLLTNCIDETVKHCSSTDVAAIICSLSLPLSGSQMGSLLAALTHFCNTTDGRAVLAIDLRKIDDDLEPEEADPFENPKWVDEEEPEELKDRTEVPTDRNKLIETLKSVSRMFTDNVFNYNGEEFVL